MTASDRPLRILHIPVDLGGHAKALAECQRKLGHEVVVANLHWSPFGFNGEINYGLPPGNPLRLPLRETGRLLLFLRSLLWADVIHAHFGQSLFSLRAFPLQAPGRDSFLETLTVRLCRMLWLKDIQLWHRLGRKLAMTFYGDDLRLVSDAAKRNPWSHLADESVSAPLRQRDDLKKELVRQLVNYDVKLFAANPDLMAFLPSHAEFLPYGHVDVVATAIAPSYRTGFLRFLHMPTDRQVKGTQHFIESVERLQKKGVACSLTIVENKNNSEVAGLIASHDVILDQLHVGWYGGFALEAMAAGKPVVAHIVEEDLQYLPPDMAAALPVISANPSTIDQALLKLSELSQQDYDDLSKRSRDFALQWHDPSAIAQRVLRAYSKP